MLVEFSRIMFKQMRSKQFSPKHISSLAFKIFSYACICFYKDNAPLRTRTDTYPHILSFVFAKICTAGWLRTAFFVAIAIYDITKVVSIDFAFYSDIICLKDILLIASE